MLVPHPLPPVRLLFPFFFPSATVVDSLPPCPSFSPPVFRYNNLSFDRRNPQTAPPTGFLSTFTSLCSPSFLAQLPFLLDSLTRPPHRGPTLSSVSPCPTLTVLPPPPYPSFVLPPPHPQFGSSFLILPPTCLFSIERTPSFEFWELSYSFEFLAGFPPPFGMGHNRFKPASCPLSWLVLYFPFQRLVTSYGGLWSGHFSFFLPSGDFGLRFLL